MKKERQFIICLLLIATGLVISTINVFTLIEELISREDFAEETTSVVNSEPDTSIQEETIETTYPEKEKIELTSEEFEEFCIVGMVEFGLESIEGQIAGFATILNRWLESTEHPDTLHEVIYQPYQFSAVRNGEIYIWKNGSYVVAEFEDVGEMTIIAAQRALEGEDPTEQLLWKEAERKGLDPKKYAENGALFFYNPDYCSEAELESREYIKVKVKIGNHVFYKVWDLPEE